MNNVWTMTDTELTQAIAQQRAIRYDDRFTPIARSIAMLIERTLIAETWYRGQQKYI